MNWDMLIQPWLAAFGWTLLHSLWQGALAAGLLALAFQCIDPKAASLRYGLAVSALALMLLGSGYTFVHYFEPVSLSGMASQDAAVPLMPPPPPVLIGPDSFAEGSPAWELPMATLAPWLFYGWLLGFAFFSLRWLGGMVYLQRIRQQASSPRRGPWEGQLHRMAQRLGLPRPVRLLESSRLQAPMVSGHFNPVILLPLGLITQLSPAQLEAVIAHELAHIRRHDFLINLLQTWVETLFFYHPASWWISNRIRDEREHCCDDLAVSLSGDALGYAHTLANLAAQEWKSTALAPGFAGRKGQLLARVQRLLLPGPEKHGWQGRVVAILLLATGLLCAAFMAPSNRPVEEQAWPEVSSLPPAGAVFGDVPAGHQPFYAPVVESPAPAPAAPSPRWGEEAAGVAPAAPVAALEAWAFMMRAEGQTLRFAWADSPEVPVAPPAPPVSEAPEAPQPTPSPRPNPQPAPAPPMPAMPALPALPAMPPMPPMPPMNVEADQGFDEAWEARMKAYGEEMEAWAEQWEAAHEGWEESFEVQMESYGEQMEAWAESFEAQWEAYEGNWEAYGEATDAFDSDRLAEAMDRQQEALQRQKEAMQRMKEAERRVVEQQHRQMRQQQRQMQEQIREEQARLRAMDARQRADRERFASREQSLRSVLLEDGYLESYDDRVRISCKDEVLRINGTKVEGEAKEKYLRLLKSHGLNCGENTSFNLTWD